MHRIGRAVIANAFAAWAMVASNWLGTAWAFMLALLSVIGWAISGPFFNYSDQWSLAINTGTTIVTFLMMFIVQNTQNRHSAAINLKLAELILVTEAARNVVATAERLTEDEIRDLGPTPPG